MPVERADQESERLQRRRRTDVGIDVRRRRVVLDRRVFIVRVGASGALKTRRDVGQTKQSPLRRPSERAAERFRVADEFLERRAVLIALRRGRRGACIVAAWASDTKQPEQRRRSWPSSASAGAMR